MMLWLWTLLRQRRERRSTPPSRYHQVEAEDVLKAAYVAEEEHGQLSGQTLSQTASLPDSMTDQALAALLAFDWAEKGEEGTFRLTP
jgi:DNA-binding IclR family transcriptional regulator